ncbi:glycosyltransferase family 2 protein [uncultured Mailhella sp.]|uniref:glycosyltransferase family 2 protein n=1 Tax=uncultured Mailhella sp. TaxID=1981031 RepID=UPI0026172D28|nr:glycosyltransferase family 2 protein [uncultured Mailhella sp.]
MHHPLVSIITVTLNCLADGRKDFLLQNFESVHRQTYDAVEHIVVDGASTDGTVELLEEYQSKGWITYTSEKDNGIYDAMNKGCRLARGDYVLVLNSDDWYAADDIVEKMAALAEKHGADYVYGHQICCSRDGRKRRLEHCHPYSFWYSMPFNHPACMIKKAVVQRQGGYRTDFDTVEDYRFFIQLILDDYKGVMLDEPICNYRLGGVTLRSDRRIDHYDLYYRRLAKLYCWFYRKFDDRLTEERIIANYIGEIGGEYDNMFFIRLIRFMLNLKLRYFDYEQFLKFIESISDIHGHEKFVKTIFLLGIPIFKIKISKKISKYYLFGKHLMFLRVKSENRI